MYTIDAFKQSLLPVIAELKKEFGGIRTNRPSSALVEDLKVSYYGEMLPIKQVASISVIPPREIVVQVWDKEAIAGVVKAIESAQLGATASADGLVVHVRFPELSLERREEFSKHVKRIAEEHRIRIRHARDEANKQTEKALEDNDITEDQKFKLKESIQKETDRVNEEVEKLVEQKVKEILE